MKPGRKHSYLHICITDHHPSVHYDPRVRTVRLPQVAAKVGVLRRRALPVPVFAPKRQLLVVKRARVDADHAVAGAIDGDWLALFEPAK